MVVIAQGGARGGGVKEVLGDGGGVAEVGGWRICTSWHQVRQASTLQQGEPVVYRTGQGW